MSPPIKPNLSPGARVPFGAQPRNDAGTENRPLQGKSSPPSVEASAPAPEQARLVAQTPPPSGNPLFRSATVTALNRKQALESSERLSEHARSLLGQDHELSKEWSAIQGETDPDKRFQKLQSWLSRAHKAIVAAKREDEDYRSALADHQDAQKRYIQAALADGSVKNFWGERLFLGEGDTHEVELVRRAGRVGVLEWTKGGAPTFRSADGQAVVRWSGNTSSAYLNGRLTRREHYAGKHTSYFEQGSFENGKLVNGSTGMQNATPKGVEFVKVSNVFTGVDEESDRKVNKEEFLRPDGGTVGEVFKYLDNGEVNVMCYAPDGRHWRTDFESSALETAQIWAAMNNKGEPDYAKIGRLKHEIVWTAGKAVKREAVLDEEGRVLLWRVSRHDSIGAALESQPASKPQMSVPLDGLAAVKDPAKRLEKARQLASTLNKERGVTADDTEKETLARYLAQSAEFTELEEGQSLSLDCTSLDRGPAAGHPVFVMRRRDKDGSFVEQIAVVSSVASEGEQVRALAVRVPVYYDKDGKPLEKQAEGAGQFVKKWYGTDGKEYRLENFETQFDSLGNTYRLSGTHLVGSGAGPESVTVETVASRTQQIGPGLIDRAGSAYMDSLRAQGFQGEIQAAFLGGAADFIGDVGHVAAYVGGTAYHTGKSLLLTGTSWALDPDKPWNPVDPYLVRSLFDTIGLSTDPAEYDFGAEAEANQTPLIRTYVNWAHGDQADAYRMGRLRGSEKTTLERDLADQRIAEVDSQAFRMDSPAKVEAYDRASRTPAFQDEAGRQKALLGVFDRTGTAEELIDWGFEKGREGQTGLQWAGIGLGIVDTLGKTSAETLPFVGVVGAFGRGVQWLGRAEQISQNLKRLADAGKIANGITHWLMQGQLVADMGRNVEAVSVAAAEGDTTKAIIAGTHAAVNGVFVAAAAQEHAKQRAQQRAQARTQESARTETGETEAPAERPESAPRAPESPPALPAAEAPAPTETTQPTWRPQPAPSAIDAGTMPARTPPRTPARHRRPHGDPSEDTHRPIGGGLARQAAPARPLPVDIPEGTMPMQPPAFPSKAPGIRSEGSHVQIKPSDFSEWTPRQEVAVAVDNLQYVYEELDGLRRSNGYRYGPPTSPVEVLESNVHLLDRMGYPLENGQVGIEFKVGTPKEAVDLVDHIAQNAPDLGQRSMPLKVVERRGPKELVLETPSGRRIFVRIWALEDIENFAKAQKFIEPHLQDPDVKLIDMQVSPDGVVKFTVRYNKGAGYFSDTDFYYDPKAGGGQMYAPAP